jgi:hypothetical protein
VTAIAKALSSVIFADSPGLDIVRMIALFLRHRLTRFVASRSRTFLFAGFTELRYAR